MDRVVATSVGDAPGRRVDLVDPDDERLAGLRTADEDRPGQRVTLVELGAPRCEVLVARNVPGVVRGEELDRVARVDLDRGLEVLREMTVQEALLESQLVEH